ncbi:glutamine--fructose-6-phosphate transaminase (isomerizing) [Desulfonatronospira sp.]|uniref:glutamine--fructose-6-phosphate transaminase (isomerizing) n=1 Tax=Desulfonatronospira sp. TaxID=1962951 RepID=UPI0025BD8274|nr:glutamine--fructose-6-phosphate transaminase (isomerizing) [Desulfonatronospira sp.]
MCGIIAYTGHRPAVPVIIQGLKSLEYRGYDSAGLCFCHLERLHLFRAAGKLHFLEQKLEGPQVLHATSGIGHTRWATHGLPNETNAHPHLDVHDNLALVHNGIIENYQQLKAMLIGTGCTFRSQTDTEVMVCLISHALNQHSSIRQALAWSLSQVQGSYAFALISRNHEGKVWAARKASPLILGAGTGENFVASDIPAFLPFTRNVVFLEDGELVEMDAGQWTVYDLSNLEPVSKQIQRIDWDVQSAQKGGYKHFMLKEIFEQPQVLTDCLAGRLDFKKYRVNLSELEGLPVPSRLHIMACGTSYHAGLWGRYVLESLARIPVNVEIASEFRYKELVDEPGALYLSISQSGETADTLAGQRMVRERGLPVLGLCNVVGSSVARESDRVLYTQAGPEISVASTKAMCSQLVMLYILALYWAQSRNVITPRDMMASLGTLESLAFTLDTQLPGMQKRAQEICPHYSKAQSFFFLGRGIYYPLALEGALKLKEISYIHAQGYPAGELKHGPIALIEPEVPTFALALDNFLLDKIGSNLMEVRARKGKIIALTNPGVQLEIDEKWEIPQLGDPLNSFLVLPALQLFAYEMAVYLGKDVDQPRNLAKSVTVE